MTMIIKKHLSTNNKTAGRNTCEYIIAHHTATGEGSIDGVLKTLTVSKSPHAVSCHYVIDTTGTLYKIWEDTDILWHAWESSWMGRNGMNQYSIGIEVIWPLKNGWFTDRQRSVFKELVLELSALHNIDSDRLLRHKDISPGRKIDILDTFWNWQFATWQEYKSNLFNMEPQMPLEDLATIWKTNVPIKQRKFNDYSLDTRVKYLIDIGK